MILFVGIAGDTLCWGCERDRSNRPMLVPVVVVVVVMRDANRNTCSMADRSSTVRKVKIYSIGEKLDI
ncbi:hypothetical protein [Oryza sativa Japonica Group]|uniref:Uncharacterized protein n=1 Tax=Oryza sativa subsp. japonica TaxID=39947 RepID=Q5ZBD0_ORYSJ|nr:hypothetical protein [Oryza sativa Japonica Group]